jgi:hypothetical protein
MLGIRVLMFLILAAALALPGVARAQKADHYLEYFEGANNEPLPDGTVRIVPTGTAGLAGSSTICDPRGDQTPSPLYASVWATHLQDWDATAEGELNSQFDYYQSPNEIAALVARCKLTNEVNGSDK